VYKVSWSTYQIARWIIRVRHLALPNLLAGHAVMPELLQDQAEPGVLARLALDLLSAPDRLAGMRRELDEVVGRLGAPGAARRAAHAILGLLESPAAASAPRPAP